MVFHVVIKHNSVGNLKMYMKYYEIKRLNNVCTLWFHFAKVFALKINEVEMGKITYPC